MAIFRRVLGWTVSLVALGALGLVTFAIVRYRPRCVIEGNHGIMTLSANGSSLLTFTANARGTGGGAGGGGPLHVWDTHCGRSRRTFLDDAERINWCLLPENRVVADPGDGTLRFLDWRSGDEHSLELPERGGWKEM